MTETEKKALALVNEVREERDESPLDKLNRDHISSQEVLCRTIEQFEAFRQEVSDAVEDVDNRLAGDGFLKIVETRRMLAPFILPKPDPLVEVWLEAFPGNHIDDARDECAKINAALAARGLTITETKEKN